MPELSSPMPARPRPDAATRAVVAAAFDRYNRIAVRRGTDGPAAGLLELAFVAPDVEALCAQLSAAFGQGAFTKPALQFSVELGAAVNAGEAGGSGDALSDVYFSQVEDLAAAREKLEPREEPDGQQAPLSFYSIEALERAAERGALAAPLRALLAAIEPHLLRIPYLHLGENDFIYKFRPEKERNISIYANDADSSALYQSRLCELIKRRARTREGSASAPVALDFGAIAYHIPSHFGFCLGVKNAIERAYEALAANPSRRVFMLSELIHNPFVNADLLRRGLSYLQSDKGEPFTLDGRLAKDAEPGAPLRWDTLSSEDVVIIPAFGATDEDKRRLVRKGIAVYQYDATCMLVEKVWKAARNYGRKGYTVIIHGKAEHEETKATFSNTRRYAPALIVRDLGEVQQLGRLIEASRAASAPGAAPELAESLRREFSSHFEGKHTPGFDALRDLERVAVVNQTTLLVNETRAIIDYLHGVYAARYGAQEAAERVGGSGKNDTLCYATQVNQDALTRALEEPLDAAFVIGGRNSSNTYQLYRLCEKALGPRAYFIQSERDILSAAEVEHFVFPYTHGATGHSERRPLWPAAASLSGPESPSRPRKQVLITGGASCPDGLIQQTIARLNSFFPASALRPVEALLAELGSEA